jgi:hypothetical protein
MDKTAIVILNWNGIRYLKQFLGTVTAYSEKSGTAIYLADNCSGDGSVDWVEKNHPGVKVIRLERNHGYAGGYNRALEQIPADYYILLNSDVEVTPGWADELISFMDNNPDVAACQPKILSWHRRDHFEYAGGAGGFIDKYGYPFCRGRLFHICEKDNGQYDNIEEVFWTSGSCMIIRSDAWCKCGGLDQDFFAHMEEIDLCWRLILSGYRLFYNPGSVVYHVGGGALPYETPLKAYLNFRNNLFMLYKNLPGNKLTGTLFIRKVLDGVASGVFLITGKFWKVRSVLRAHIDYYKASASLHLKRNNVSRDFPENPSRLILNKSIVFEFYIKGNRTFTSLGTNFKSK